MTDLELIENLEQHTGFILNRLTCDGNIYAGAIDLGCASRAHNSFIEAFMHLRRALKWYRDMALSETVIKSMNDFDSDDWRG